MEPPRALLAVPHAREQADPSWQFVLVVTAGEISPHVRRAVATGDGSYVLERATPAELVEHLRAHSPAAASSSIAVLRRLLDLLPSPSAPPALSPREHAVLRCLVEGYSYKEVAAHLGLQIDTVRTYVRAVYRKLDVHSVAAAVSQALRQGLV